MLRYLFLASLFCCSAQWLLCQTSTNAFWSIGGSGGISSAGGHTTLTLQYDHQRWHAELGPLLMVSKTYNPLDGPWGFRALAGHELGRDQSGKFSNMIGVEWRSTFLKTGVEPGPTGKLQLNELLATSRYGWQLHEKFQVNLAFGVGLLMERFVPPGYEPSSFRYLNYHLGIGASYRVK